MAGAFSADTYRFLSLRKQLHAQEIAGEAAVAGEMCDTVDSFCRLESAKHLLTTFVVFESRAGVVIVLPLDTLQNLSHFTESVAFTNHARYCDVPRH